MTDIALEKTVCQLDDGGFFVMMTTVDYDPFSGEYLMPPNTIDTEQPENRDGYKAKWLPEQQAWTYISDFRGKKMYKKSDGSSVVVSEIGDVPDDLTAQKQPTPYHVWNGSGWELSDNAAELVLNNAKKVVLETLRSKAQVFIENQINTTYFDHVLYAEWKEEYLLNSKEMPKLNAFLDSLNIQPSERQSVKDKLIENLIFYYRLIRTVAAKRYHYEMAILKEHDINLLNNMVFEFELPPNEEEVTGIDAEGNVIRVIVEPDLRY